MISFSRFLKTSVLLITPYVLLSGCVSPEPSSASNQRKNSLFGSFFSGTNKDNEPINESYKSPPPKAVKNIPSQIQNNAQLPSPNMQFRTGNSPFDLQKVDTNIWRSGMGAGNLFSTLAKIISQNYIIASADRRQLTLTTDWDKFFIEGKLFRNRLSISVFPLSSRQTELVIKNSVEYYAGKSSKIDENSSMEWLPSQDLTDEVQRIIESINKQISLLQVQTR